MGVLGAVRAPLPWWNNPSRAHSLVWGEAGQSHSLALTASGSVIGVGLNSSAQLGIPGGATGFAEVTAGLWNSLALKRNGDVVTWETGGEVGVPPTSLTNVVAVSAWTHSLALKADGTVASCGWNAFGQATVPAGLTGVVAISAGDRHSLALRSSGAAAAPRLLGPAEIRGDAWVPGFYHRIVAANGPVSFDVTGLPNGLAHDPQTGIISGQPMQTGTFPLTLSAENLHGTDSRMMTLIVGGEPVVAMALKSQYILGTAATGTLKVYGNPVITATGLPPGLSLSPDGVLSGTPQLAGNFSASLTLTNPWGTRIPTVGQVPCAHPLLLRGPRCPTGPAHESIDHGCF